ncbi:M81 family metallopeptidase [Saccharothrix sp. NPDC042600]|uniref:M81 family metallopeptidase n=1 Tax=Saccharothrix TaxID=2071 RepID=UPI0033F52621|nr:M81 family metallopeptidase [Saccharothrix mutabilis subsp. capreolus]
MERIAICGIGTESSTFSAHRTTRDDFTVWRDLSRYPFLDDLPGVEFVPVLIARALPGGPVRADAFAELLDGITAGLAERGPFDGVYLDLHGAMHVEGLDDAETHLARRVRQVVGDVPMSASMDLHGQVTREFAELVDLPTAYRTAPHVDVEETRQRACRLLVDRLRAGGRPVRAWVRVPLLLPGERTSTRLDPARALYARLPAVSARPGVLDASIWIGYAWADAPRSAVNVLVAGTSADAVTGAARELAEDLWEARDDFAFCVPARSPADAVRAALDSDRRPFFVSDCGDNPTAGGSGDATFFLRTLLDTPALAAGARTAVWASCVDPAAVRACRDTGGGGAVDLAVGGCLSGDEPTRLTGVVHKVVEDDPVGGDIAVVRSGGVHAVLTSRRKPYHLVADLTALDLDPAAHDLTAVKIGYLEPDLHRAAAGSVLALTPGGVSQDLAGLRYERLVRPIHPLDAGMPHPDLTPVLVGTSR